VDIYSILYNGRRQILSKPNELQSLLIYIIDGSPKERHIKKSKG